MFFLLILLMNIIFIKKLLWYVDLKIFLNLKGILKNIMFYESLHWVIIR